MINDGKFGMKLFEKYRDRIYAVDGSNLAINPAAELRKVEKFLHLKDNYFSNIRYLSKFKFRNFPFYFAHIF